METKIYFILFVFLLLSCNTGDNNKIQYENLEFIKESPVYAPGISGLSFSANKTAFYTVSDNTARIYKISFTGALIETYSFKGNDLEGITIDPNTEDIYVVEERNRDVVRLNSEGTELNRFHLDIPENNDNSGLEGITFNNDNNHLFILNEKDPGLLIEIDDKGKIINQTELDFASDYSGIFYESEEKLLWIVSDQSKTITKCKLNGEKILSYKINEAKAEGIVVDGFSKKIYIVLDGKDVMQVYSYK